MEKKKKCSILTRGNKLVNMALENCTSSKDTDIHQRKTIIETDVHPPVIVDAETSCNETRTAPSEVITCVMSIPENTNVSAERPQKKKCGSRRLNWCKFCESMQTKIGRHMASKHKNVREVQEYLNTVDETKETQKKRRREICKMLINDSNKIYNERVMRNEIVGQLIPVKKCQADPASDSHVICTVCGGLIMKKHFSNHKITCKKRQNLFKNEQYVVPSARLLGPSLDAKYHALQTKVLDKMNKDEITFFIQNDPLILEFGRRFLKGHMAGHQRNYVAIKMRTLANLVLRMKKLDPDIRQMSDCLRPTNFDILCQVVKEWSDYNEDSGLCQKGSVPRRLCKSIKVCSQVLWSEAIKNKSLNIDEQLQIRNNHEKFMSLMETDWKMEVNTIGDKSLKFKKMLGEGKMPAEDDIVTFFKEMTSEIEKATAVLKLSKVVENYDRVTKATLAYLIAFNSRRPGEVAYATLSNYKNIKIDSSNTENLGVFTVTASKNDVRVPVIVPLPVQLAINTVIDHRSAFNVVGDLLFCKKDGTPYNGSEVLSKFKLKMNLKNPDAFTANGLRHYWATISQMDPELKKHMPKFLGHTLSTHQKYYEMPMADIHLKVVGPVIHKHCLRSKSEEQTVSHRALRPRASASVINSDINFEDVANEDVDDTINDVDYNVEDEFATPKKRKLLSIEEYDDDSTSDESTTSALPLQKRNRWITPEKEELLKELPKTMLGLEPAGRGKIRRLWEKSKVIKERHSLQMTRIEVSKYYTKKKKITTPLKRKYTITNTDSE